MSVNSTSMLPVRPAPSFVHAHHGGPRTVFISTYPPTRCGIATFSASLLRALASDGALSTPDVMALTAPPLNLGWPDPVVAELAIGSRACRRAAATRANEYDAVILQHEFGLYSGEDGEDVVELAAMIDAPLIVILHTVLDPPSPGQRSVINRLAEHAAYLVVQSNAARTRLLRHHDLDPDQLRTIPHGATPNFAVDEPKPAGHRPIILTWGLLSPGKGIEYAIAGLARLGGITPAPHYVILGQTHPKILAEHGESYRDSLQDLARDLGVWDSVEFDDRYADQHAILARIRQADIILLPYRSRDQVVSGVLVEALASGKPVVATRFPHAQELLANGAGITVTHDDPAAIAAGLRVLLTDPIRAARTAAAARAAAPPLMWRSVARAYRTLITQAARRATLVAT